MRLRHLAILPPILLGLTAGPGIAGSQPQPSLSSVTTAIRSALEAWKSAFNARNGAQVCDIFAPDLQYDAGPIQNGNYSGICGQLRHLLAQSEPKLHYDLDRIKDVLTAGGLAVVRLDWTLTATSAQGTPETVHEVGMDIFRRQPDDSWKIVRFMAYNPQSQVHQEGGSALP